jgi:hypothetical protein
VIGLTALGLTRADLDGVPAGQVGRVCGGGGQLVDVWTSAGPAVVPVRAAADQAVTGDWVLLSGTPGQVSRVLPRRTAVRRISTHADGRTQVLAANVDDLEATDVDELARARRRPLLRLAPDRAIIDRRHVHDPPLAARFGNRTITWPGAPVAEWACIGAGQVPA